MIGVEVFEAVEAVTDILQIGARNMQNYPLLRRAGKSRKPVLLKRGQSATLEEFLLAAEYLLAEGNRNVILCERGIRTFSDHSRYTLDINIVPELKSLTHLPVLVDPSHASGKREMVVPLARAAFAAGADGVIVEVHPYPDKALSDGRQSLNLQLFADMMRGLERYVPRSRARTGARRMNVAHLRLETASNALDAFNRLYAGEPYAFLCESLGEAGRNRFSFFGGRPSLIHRSSPTEITIEHTATGETRLDPRDLLRVASRRLSRSPRALPDMPPFSSGVVGYLGYDVVRRFERLPASPTGSRRRYPTASSSSLPRSSSSTTSWV